MLVVDIKSAFASTIRELVLPPACDDEQRVRSIARTGCPPAEAATIVAEVLHTQLWGDASPHLRHLAGALSANQFVLLNDLSGS